MKRSGGWRSGHCKPKANDMDEPHTLVQQRGRMALLPHGGGSHHDWVSRDHPDIDCLATGCVYNHDKKCMVPSHAVFNEEARCAGFTPKPLPPKLDGD